MKRAAHRNLPLYVNQVSVTALLDLVLILLLATVVSVPFIRGKAAAGSEQSLAEKPLGAPDTKIILSVHADQTLWLDGKKVTGAELLPLLKKKLETKPEAGVLVNMPANFAAGSLASLMEEMHKLGVKRTAVNVVDAPKKP